MSLSCEQAEAIRKTWKVVRGVCGDTLGRDFLLKYLEICPNAAEKMDLADKTPREIKRDKQVANMGNKFINRITEMVESVEDSNKYAELLRNDDISKVDMGVDAKHITQAGKALLEILKDNLGRGLNGEAKSAWILFITDISTSVR